MPRSSGDMVRPSRPPSRAAPAAPAGGTTVVELPDVDALGALLPLIPEPDLSLMSDEQPASSIMTADAATAVVMAVVLVV